MCCFRARSSRSWFYPDWLRAIAAVLPFQAAYYLPVEIFLGIRDIPG